MAVPGFAAPFAAQVIDARTGEILYETNAHTRLHPASLTKMMTLYICFEAIRNGEVSLDTQVTVSKNAASEEPSKLGLRAGQRIALRYLIRAAAVKSANDAATAIGEAISGSESAFAKRMNRTARALGMNDTSFKNANGLTREGHLSTASDMTILGRHLFYDFPEYYNIFSRRTTDAGMAQVANTNRRFLDSYKGADGIKTGYTGPAGFNLVASAERGNTRIIATVFGGTSTAQRNAKVAELLDLGFARAPNRAQVRPPQLPAYVGPEADAPAVEMAEATGIIMDEGGAGKTVRVSGKIASSPRPKARPAPEPAADAVLLAAMQDEISNVLASVEGVAPAAETPALAMVATPDAGAVADAVTASSANAAPAVDPDAIAQSIAEAVAVADMAPITPSAPAIEAAPTAETLTVASVKPMPRPASTAQETVAVAAADQAAAIAEPPVQEADNAAVLEPTVMALMAQPSTAPAEQVVMAEPAPQTPLAAELPFELVSSSAASSLPENEATPKPRPEMVMLAAVSPDAALATEAPEVVTRLSTSDGRVWGVTLGKFNSSYDAERQLMNTALAESGTLSEALRKVVKRKAGYEANFMGMSQDQADLACRRLLARNIQCFTLGP